MPELLAMAMSQVARSMMLNTLSASFPQRDIVGRFGQEKLEKSMLLYLCVESCYVLCRYLRLELVK